MIGLTILFYLTAFLLVCLSKRKFKQPALSRSRARRQHSTKHF